MGTGRLPSPPDPAVIDDRPPCGYVAASRSTIRPFVHATRMTREREKEREREIERSTENNRGTRALFCSTRLHHRPVYLPVSVLTPDATQRRVPYIRPPLFRPQRLIFPRDVVVSFRTVPHSFTLFILSLLPPPRMRMHIRSSSCSLRLARAFS